MTRDESKLLYAETHEWVEISEDGSDKIATVGISAFAIEQLNDLVYMDLPEVGRVVAVGDEFGEVESVKAVSPLYAPIAGEVIEVNSELPNKLDQLNIDPLGQGWIVKIRISDDSGLDALMDFSAYQKQCSEAG